MIPSSVLEIALKLRQSNKQLSSHSSGYNTGGLTLVANEFLSLTVWLSWGWRVYPKLIHMCNWQAGMFALLTHPSLYDRRLVSSRASGPREQWIKREHTIPLMTGFVSFLSL